LVHVITQFKRPSKDLIDKFRDISTATVHEANEKKGAVDCAIKPIKSGIRLCGPAFTVQCAPGDNLMLHKALEKAQPGDILVASVGGHYEAGYWGALMATSAVAKNLGGLAIDGCIRDSAEIIRIGFPVFCRGFCIKGTSKTVLGLINHPILFGGVLVHPGDLVLGDDDGMVVVEQGACEEVLKRSLNRIEAERIKAEKLRGGISSVELNQLQKVFDFLGLEEE